MHNEDRNITYYLSPGIIWIVQYRGVEVVDELSRQSETLFYPEAAIWDLLCRGHCQNKVSIMLTFILDVLEKETKELTEQCISRWLKAGWIIQDNLMENQ